MEVLVEGRPVPYLLQGSRPSTIVFLPPLGALASIWEPQIEAFSVRYTVVVPELGGHHGVALDVSLASLSRDLAAVLDAVGSTWAHVVGLSLGGMVGLEFALTYPERVRSLVLVNSTSRLGDDARSTFRARADSAEREGMEPIVDGTLSRWFSPSFLASNETVVQGVRDMLLSADPRSYARVARTIASVDSYERLSAIAAPTLIVRGSEDTSMPPLASQELAEAIPGARFETVGGTAHVSPLQAAAEFNAVLESFLAAIDEHVEEDADRAEPMHPW
jgi:3-oxoadipate enol-lactonase